MQFMAAAKPGGGGGVAYLQCQRNDGNSVQTVQVLREWAGKKRAGECII